MTHIKNENGIDFYVVGLMRLLNYGNYKDDKILYSAVRQVFGKTVTELKKEKGYHYNDDSMLMSSQKTIPYLNLRYIHNNGDTIDDKIYFFFAEDKNDVYIVVSETIIHYSKSLGEILMCYFLEKNELLNGQLSTENFESIDVNDKSMNLITIKDKKDIEPFSFRYTGKLVIKDEEGTII
jgi:hypothetical protein